MRLDVPFGDAAGEAGRPRVGLCVGHGGLREDLERALSSAGCRVATPDADGPARRFDAWVVDSAASADPMSIRFTAADAAVVWLVDSPGQEAELARAGRVAVVKPFSVADLEAALERALDPPRGAAQPPDPVLRSEEPRMREALARARRLAERGLAMVIVGELGVGRAALARATHAWSPHAGAPLVTLDRLDLGSASAEEAVAHIDAAWADAQGGTLVAIEPAEWTLPAQRAFARALRGETRTRIVTIAGEPLETAVGRGRLSQELADRLDVARITLPALRDRPADQRALCEALARRVARRLGVEVPAIDDAILAEWTEAGFPGNLLGVESRLRAALLRESVDLAPTGAALEVRRHSAEADALDLKALERETIVRALAHWQGNRTRASESLGISVRTLRNKIRDYGLR